MTSTEDRCNRSCIPPQEPPVPQPDFTNQGDVPQFLSPTGLSGPLEYFTPPVMGHQHIQAGPSCPAS